MEEFVGACFESIGNTIRKKRSQTSRRPRPESVLFPETCDRSPLSSTPSLDDLSKVSSDENTGNDTKFPRKEFNLNQCALRDSHRNVEEGSSSLLYGNGSLGDPTDEGGNELTQRRHREGMLAPANWKNKTKKNFELLSGTIDIYDGINGESLGDSRVNGGVAENDNKFKKVKLKVGSVTRTIQTKSNSHNASGSGSSAKSSRASDAHRSRQKLILQDDSDDDHSPLEKKSSVRSVPWKDLPRVGSSRGKEDISMGKKAAKNASVNQGEKSEAVRKSKRVPKRRLLDGAFDEEEDDDEIRYLEKLKISKAAAGSKDFEEESRKKQRISRVSRNASYDEISEDLLPLSSTKDNKKKSRSERGSEDTDYEEEEELVSDGEAEGKKKKKLRNDSLDSSPVESKPALTIRQRALLSSKDASSGASTIEFPNGLPPAPPRKQKEKLSEVEQQLKKAEAAQRRRMQVEKAARESEAEAIRKILGQDSSRKKREDKMRKRQEELAQEKASNALKLASNTIRYVMGPTGTTVTFPNEMGLPSLFDPRPCSYPPPRENCAGPSCVNPYKYRDSKSKLPLCSLKCYKAIHEKLQAESTSMNQAESTS